MPDWDEDATQSFSVAAALRAPIGTDLDEAQKRDVRVGARALLLGLLLVVLDIGVIVGEFAIDLVPDVLGGLFILFGVLAVGRVSTVVGPARARSRMLLLALVQLPLLAAMTLTPVEPAGSAEVAAKWMGPLQTVVACMGTALVATVLGRAHDSLGQLARRDRWSLARRTCLVAVVIWLPMSALGGIEDPRGFQVALAGLAGLIIVVWSLLTLVAVARALGGSMNVLLPDR